MTVAVSYADARHARDIPDQAVLDAVTACNEGRCENPEFFGWHGYGPGWDYQPDRDREGHWANRWDLGTALGGPPEKVLLAKLRRLIGRDLIDGCACGCRGDLTVR